MNLASLRFMPSSDAGRRSLMVWLVGLVAILLCLVVGVAALNGLQPGLTAQAWLPALIAIAAVGLLVVLAIILSATLGAPFAGALWLAAPRIPGIAAVGIVLAYLVPNARNGVVAVAVGTYAAAVMWLLLAVAFRLMARADTAHPRPYGELMERITELTLRAEGQQKHPAEIAKILRQLERARQLLHEPGKPDVPRAGKDWAAGTAYFGVWRAVHAAEEELLEYGSADMAIAEALHDDLRLSNATIDNRTVLRRSLRNAVVEIDPHAIERYFPNLEGVPDAKPRGKVTGAAAAIAPAAGGTAPAPSTGIRDPAMSTLREIRHAINEFRDTARDSLAQSRNRLLQTILVAGIVAYILLATAILSDIDPPKLQSAVVFFLVGALVGLFNRLRIEASSNRAIDDFGLFEARLLHTPLISGLAGVGGVFLVAIAPLASGIGVAGGSPIPEMDKVFDVAHNQIGLLVAALFGLTPSSIIGSLQRQTDQVKHDLASSSAVSADGQTANQNG